MCSLSTPCYSYEPRGWIHTSQRLFPSKLETHFGFLQLWDLFSLFFPSIFPKWLFQCSSKNMYLLHDAKIFTNATPSFCSAPPHIFSQMLLFFYLCFPFFLTSTSNKAGSRQWFPVLTNIAITVGALPTINSWFSLLEILRGLGSRLDLMIFENIN